MILGKRDNDRVYRLESIRSRIEQAQRWLAEFTELDPMWDYLLGKEITHVMLNGSTLSVMAEGRIDTMRDKLRERLGVSEGKKP